MNTPTVVVIEIALRTIGIAFVALAIGLFVLGSLASIRKRARRPCLIYGLVALLTSGLGLTAFLTGPAIARRERINNERRHLGTWETKREFLKRTEIEGAQAQSKMLQSMGFGVPTRPSNTTWKEAFILREDGSMEYRLPTMEDDNGRVYMPSCNGTYRVTDSTFDTVTLDMTGTLAGTWVMTFPNPDEAKLDLEVCRSDYLEKAYLSMEMQLATVLFRSRTIDAGRPGEVVIATAGTAPQQRSPEQEFYAGLRQALSVIVIGAVFLISYRITYILAKRKNKRATIWGVFGGFFFLPTLIVLAFAPHLCPHCHTVLATQDWRNKKCPRCATSWT